MITWITIEFWVEMKLWRNLLLSRKIISKGSTTFYGSTLMWWWTSRSTARSSCNLVVQSVTFLFLLGLHSVENLKFTLTQWGKWKIYCHPKKFRQINSLVFSLVKTLLSRNFCQRSVTVNFHDFLTHSVEITGIFYHAFLAKISWK